MARSQKNLGLQSMFPAAKASTATDAALVAAFPEVKEEQTLKAVVQDIGRTYGSIPIDSIVANPYQPRKKFDQQKLRELADSLNEDGMLEPILVRVSPTKSGFYEIAYGERRWRAAKLVGWTHCPAEIMTSCPDARMRRIALLENVQREQLTPLELAATYEALMQERDEHQRPVYTVRSLAEMLKKDKGHVDDHRALLRVPPDVRQLIEEDPDIPVRVIRELGNVEDAADRTYLLAEVRARTLKTADILAILQQSRRRKRASAPQEQSPTLGINPRRHYLSPGQGGRSRGRFLSHQGNDTRPPQAVASKESQPGYEEDVSAANVQGDGETPPVSKHTPSSALAFAVLERKLQKDQMQLQKIVDRITGELSSMSKEEKELLRSYLSQWYHTIQQLVDQL